MADLKIIADPKNPDAISWGLLKKLQLRHRANLVGPSLADGMTVLIEDHGQDFLEFDIKNGCIVETRPFQGWMWDGRRILNNEIEVGTRLEHQRDGEIPLTLRYPVAGIAPLSRAEVS